MDGNIYVSLEKRLIKVKDKIGYFHCWEHLSQTSNKGVPYSKVYGIVEFIDGVKRVEIEDMDFIDEANDILKDYNKIRKAERK